MSSVMRELEKGGDGVFGDDGWLNKIDQNLTSELVIFRTYRPDSIRDLLRAFHSNVSHTKYNAKIEGKFWFLIINISYFFRNHIFESYL